MTDSDKVMLRLLQSHWPGRWVQREGSGWWELVMLPSFVAAVKFHGQRGGYTFALEDPGCRRIWSDAWVVGSVERSMAEMREVARAYLLNAIAAIGGPVEDPRCP